MAPTRWAVWQNAVFCCKNLDLDLRFSSDFSCSFEGDSTRLIKHRKLGTEAAWAAIAGTAPSSPPHKFNFPLEEAATVPHTFLLQSHPFFRVLKVNDLSCFN